MVAHAVVLPTWEAEDKSKLLSQAIGPSQLVPAYLSRHISVLFHQILTHQQCLDIELLCCSKSSHTRDLCSCCATAFNLSHDYFLLTESRDPSCSSLMPPHPAQASPIVATQPVLVNENPRLRALTMTFANPEQSEKTMSCQEKHQAVMIIIIMIQEELFLHNCNSGSNSMLHFQPFPLNRKEALTNCSQTCNLFSHLPLLPHSLSSSIKLPARSMASALCSSLQQVFMSQVPMRSHAGVPGPPGNTWLIVKIEERSKMAD
ncbi:hypothetical protein AAY473_029315 [Plecturocebus cupreus]